MAKLGYIDPNPDGLDMVNNEDLSIFVELVTTKKQRSEINVDGEAKTYRFQEGGNKVPIKFLKGSDIDGDGRQELTTHYTEINTNFNEANPDLESLGITSIDIDFNTSYTPMIKINFTDVRGKLFEMGNNSPYNVFFNLPYPIFELTVKGYYGKAVTYCLHLTKFTGKLNDKTGSFEIQCEFIGYTYAFLSDMLMGLLRGVVGTSKGIEIIESIKSKNSNFLPFDELNQKIKEVSKNIENLKQGDNDLVKISLGENTLASMNKVKDVIVGFVKRISGEKDSTLYNKGNFIVIKKPTNDTELDKVINMKNLFNDNIKAIVRDINEMTKSESGSRYYLNPNTFALNQRSYADEIRKIDFEADELWGDGTDGYLVKDRVYSGKKHIVSNIITENIGRKNDGSFENPKYYKDFKDIITGISENKISNDSNMIVFDLRGLLDEINKVSKALKDDLEGSREVVSNKLVGDISEIFGFKPTIRNMVYILTEHVHILMKAIKSVAQEVEDSKEGRERAEQLKNVVVNRKNDVANGVETECSRGNVTGSSDDLDINEILPFPDYKESGIDGVFEDKWIGDVAPDIPEVIFINELLDSLLKAREQDDDVLDYLENLEDEWYPINPFDTSLMSSGGNPWKKFQNESINVGEVIRHMLTRMSIYLGYSNNKISNEEVIAMAKLEAGNVFKHITNPDIRDGIPLFGDGNSSADSFYNTILEYMLGGGNQLWDNKTKKLTGGSFIHRIGRFGSGPISDNSILEDIYRYVGVDENQSSTPIIGTEKWYLPLSSENKNIDWYNGDSIIDGTTGGGDIFFSNTVGGNDKKDWKAKTDDGSTSIEIMTVSEYTKNQGQYPNPEGDVFKGVNTDSIFNLTNIIDLEENGISKYSSSFGGTWATREIRLVELDEEIINYEGPVGSWVRFYGTTFDRPYFTGERKFKWEGGTNYDIKIDSATYKVSGNLKDDIENCGFMRDQTDILHPLNRVSPAYGKTMDVMVNKVENSDNKATIPFLGFETYSPRDKTDKWSDLNQKTFNKGDNLFAQYPIFGSELYYNQTIEGKAYLFLHSIPWNGLTSLTKNGANNLGVKDFNVFDYDSLLSIVGKKNYKKNYTGSKDNEVRGVGMSSRASGLFTHQIQHFFKHSSGFIEVPYLWVCFVGALLWRFRAKEDPIKWVKDGYNLIPLQKRGYEAPKKDEYCLANINGNEVMGFFVGDEKYIDNLFPSKLSTFFTDWMANNKGRFIQSNVHLFNVEKRNKISDELDGVDIEYAPYISLERTISYMPEGMGQKFVDEFLNFANIPFGKIRRQYDMFLDEDGNDATDKERVLAWLDWDQKMKTDPNGWIGFNDIGEYDGDKRLNPNLAKNYIIASRDNKYATYFNEGKGESEGINNQAYKAFEALRVSSKTDDVKYQDALEIARTLTNGSPFNFFLEMRGGDDTAQGLLFNSLSDTRIIASSSGRLWDSDGKLLDEIVSGVEDELNPLKAPDIKWTSDKTEIYIKTFHNEYKRLLEVNKDAISDEDKIKQRLFNSIENSDVKLQLYKTVKSIYDKWVPGSVCELELCGGGISNGNVENCPQLIDTFTFIDRAYNDIGDKFLVNPVDMVKEMVSDYNIGMYDYLARVLVGNNFNFIPLPTYINFNDESEVRAVFEPNPFNEMEDSSGPTFVCMYLGEGSKNLNLGSNSQYPDDGFNLGDAECLPPDFKSDPVMGDSDINETTSETIIIDKETGGDESDPDFTNDDINVSSGSNVESTVKAIRDNTTRLIPAFKVAYGHQNQNFFKNFQLDQSEFTETEESLKIIDELSNHRSSNIGQNMYNVYRTRAYSATIDMMGNSQIQPFMYFQLDNVPMFSGAYTIIRVNHKIKPNHMSTQFKGVRVRKTRTPMVKSTMIMMNMVGSVADVDYSESSLDGLYSLSKGKFLDYDYELNPNSPGKPPWSKCINYQIPIKGIGFEVQSEEKVKNGSIVNYTVKEVGEVFEKVAKAWYNLRKDTDESDTIYYNDFSRLGGGKHAPHASHKTGLSADMRQPTKNKNIEKTNTVGYSNYDSEGTKQFIELMLEHSLNSGYWTLNPPLAAVYFADQNIVDYFKNEYPRRNEFRSDGIVRLDNEHANHLHFEWNIPDRIENSKSDGYSVCADSSSDSRFPNTSNETKGDIRKIPRNELPTPSAREKSLGKIE